MLQNRSSVLQRVAVAAAILFSAHLSCTRAITVARKRAAPILSEPSQAAARPHPDAKTIAATVVPDKFDDANWPDIANSTQKGAAAKRKPKLPPRVTKVVEIKKEAPVAKTMTQARSSLGGAGQHGPDLQEVDQKGVEGGPPTTTSPSAGTTSPTSTSRVKLPSGHETSPRNKISLAGGGVASSGSSPQGTRRQDLLRNMLTRADQKEQHHQLHEDAFFPLEDDSVLDHQMDEDLPPMTREVSEPAPEPEINSSCTSKGNYAAPPTAGDREDVELLETSRTTTVAPATLVTELVPLPLQPSETITMEERQPVEVVDVDRKKDKDAIRSTGVGEVVDGNQEWSLPAALAAMQIGGAAAGAASSRTPCATTATIDRGNMITRSAVLATGTSGAPRGPAAPAPPAANEDGFRASKCKPYLNFGGRTFDFEKLKPLGFDQHDHDDEPADDSDDLDASHLWAENRGTRPFFYCSENEVEVEHGHARSKTPGDSTKWTTTRGFLFSTTTPYNSCKTNGPSCGELQVQLLPTPSTMFLPDRSLLSQSSLGWSSTPGTGSTMGGKVVPESPDVDPQLLLSTTSRASSHEQRTSIPATGASDSSMDHVDADDDGRKMKNQSAPAASTRHRTPTRTSTPSRFGTIGDHPFHAKGEAEACTGELDQNEGESCAAKKTKTTSETLVRHKEQGVVRRTETQEVATSSKCTTSNSYFSTLSKIWGDNILFCGACPDEKTTMPTPASTYVQPKSLLSLLQLSKANYAHKASVSPLSSTSDVLPAKMNGQATWSTPFEAVFAKWLKIVMESGATATTSTTTSSRTTRSLPHPPPRSYAEALEREEKLRDNEERRKEHVPTWLLNSVVERHRVFLHRTASLRTENPSWCGGTATEEHSSTAGPHDLQSEEEVLLLAPTSPLLWAFRMAKALIADRLSVLFHELLYLHDENAHLVGKGCSTSGEPGAGIPKEPARRREQAQKLLKHFLYDKVFFRYGLPPAESFRALLAQDTADHPRLAACAKKRTQQAEAVEGAVKNDDEVVQKEDHKARLFSLKNLFSSEIEKNVATSEFAEELVVKLLEFRQSQEDFTEAHLRRLQRHSSGAEHTGAAAGLGGARTSAKPISSPAGPLPWDQWLTSVLDKSYGGSSSSDKAATGSSTAARTAAGCTTSSSPGLMFTTSKRTVSASASATVAAPAAKAPATKKYPNSVLKLEPKMPETDSCAIKPRSKYSMAHEESEQRVSNQVAAACASTTSGTTNCAATLAAAWHTWLAGSVKLSMTVAKQKRFGMKLLRPESRSTGSTENQEQNSILLKPKVGAGTDELRTAPCAEAETSARDASFADLFLNYFASGRDVFEAAVVQDRRVLREFLVEDFATMKICGSSSWPGSFVQFAREADQRPCAFARETAAAAAAADVGRSSGEADQGRQRFVSSRSACCVGEDYRRGSVDEDDHAACFLEEVREEEQAEAGSCCDSTELLQRLPHQQRFAPRSSKFANRGRMKEITTKPPTSSRARRVTETGRDHEAPPPPPQQHHLPPLFSSGGEIDRPTTVRGLTQQQQDVDSQLMLQYYHHHFSQRQVHLPPGVAPAPEVVDPAQLPTQEQVFHVPFYVAVRNPGEANQQLQFFIPSIGLTCNEEAGKSLPQQMHSLKHKLVKDILPKLLLFPPDGTYDEMEMAKHLLATADALVDQLRSVVHSQLYDHSHADKASGQRGQQQDPCSAAQQSQHFFTCGGAISACVSMPPPPAPLVAAATAGPAQGEQVHHDFHAAMMMLASGGPAGLSCAQNNDPGQNISNGSFEFEVVPEQAGFGDVEQVHFAQERRQTHSFQPRSCEVEYPAAAAAFPTNKTSKSSSSTQEQMLLTPELQCHAAWGRSTTGAGEYDLMQPQDELLVLQGDEAASPSHLASGKEQKEAAAMEVDEDDAVQHISELCRKIIRGAGGDVQHISEFSRRAVGGGLGNGKAVPTKVPTPTVLAKANAEVLGRATLSTAEGLSSSSTSRGPSCHQYIMRPADFKDCENILLRQRLVEACKEEERRKWFAFSSGTSKSIPSAASDDETVAGAGGHHVVATASAGQPPLPTDEVVAAPPTAPPSCQEGEPPLHEQWAREIWLHIMYTTVL
ncbi:unnamed protein product [Amoebophrya sp. A120]|nr:unnamed protein product [Amoebophrya sp. A120]|eukprot:GSA120T00010032001.1